MTTTADRNHPGLYQTKPDGQQAAYLVLSEEERAEGFVRPVRREYRHTGTRPSYPLRDLTPGERKSFAHLKYVKFEMYPPSRSPAVGRFWTEAALAGGCGCVTHINRAIAETYARLPKFYGSTFCVQCGRHFPVEEFQWLDGSVVGS